MMEGNYTQLFLAWQIQLAAMLPIRTATAATSAAPRPLPSSDSIKSNCNDKFKFITKMGNKNTFSAENDRQRAPLSSKIFWDSNYFEKCQTKCRKEKRNERLVFSFVIFI